MNSLAIFIIILASCAYLSHAMLDNKAITSNFHSNNYLMKQSAAGIVHTAIAAADNNRTYYVPEGGIMNTGNFTHYMLPAAAYNNVSWSATTDNCTSHQEHICNSIYNSSNTIYVRMESSNYFKNDLHSLQMTCITPKRILLMCLNTHLLQLQRTPPDSQTLLTTSYMDNNGANTCSLCRYIHANDPQHLPAAALLIPDDSRLQDEFSL